MTRRAILRSALRGLFVAVVAVSLLSQGWAPHNALLKGRTAAAQTLAPACPPSIGGAALLTAGNLATVRNNGNEWFLSCSYLVPSHPTEISVRWNAANPLATYACGLPELRATAGEPYVYRYSQTKAALLWVSGPANLHAEMLQAGAPMLAAAEALAAPCPRTQAAAPVPPPDALQATAQALARQPAPPPPPPAQPAPVEPSRPTSLAPSGANCQGIEQFFPCLSEDSDVDVFGALEAYQPGDQPLSLTGYNEAYAANAAEVLPHFVGVRKDVLKVIGAATSNATPREEKAAGAYATMIILASLQDNSGRPLYPSVRAVLADDQLFPIVDRLAANAVDSDKAATGFERWIALLAGQDIRARQK